MISNKAKQQISDKLGQGNKKNILEKINHLIKKYPQDKQKSVVIEALKLVQAKNKGFLNAESIQEVANIVKMSEIEVQEVATFYENFNHAPVGKFQIRFCHNISCMLNGADDLITYLEEKLDIKVGQVTKDKKFSLKKVECLGACVGAPMMQIGDEYYENLTKNKLDDILDNL
jgi:NADH-quinone oxidoreductase subunit E